MGRIVSSITIDNISDPSKTICCDAFVDTGASYMVLPKAWNSRLGDLEKIAEVELETATQGTIRDEIYGPVRIQIEGFRPIYNEVLLVDINRYRALGKLLLLFNCIKEIQKVLKVIIIQIPQF